MILDQATESIIKSICDSTIVNENLVLAIINTETEGNGWATRYEPSWKYFYMPLSLAKKLNITMQTEQMLQSMSWGPMQIMGSVARELGFDDHMTKLVLPENGILYGVKKLAGIMKKYKNEDDVIAAYNAGTPKMLDNGAYENQTYVDKVNLYLDLLSKGGK